MLTSENDFHLLALYRLLVDSPRAMASLMTHFGPADQVFKFARPDDLLRAGLRKPLKLELSRDLVREVETDLRWLETDGHHLYCLGGDNYPLLLQEIYDPPCLLFAMGEDPQLLSNSCVAMVGSRSATQYGVKQAESISSDLAAAGIVVVSGLALGIDGAAHRGALKGGGKTVAVLGTGCDNIYPVRHRKLAEHVMNDGLIVSEFPLGTPALQYNFPRRNRVVTGLCRATIVIEAALKSGSLISARLAGSEGREVMAVPGNVTNRTARGCHKLIKDGARLIETASDVMEELGYSPAANLTRHLDERQRSVICALADGPKSIDILTTETECEVEELISTLVGLEVLGLIYSDAGNYALCAPPD